MKMIDQAIPLMEDRPASAAPPDGVTSWPRSLAGSEDCCVVLTAADDLLRPPGGVRSPLIAELWDRPDFLAQFPPLARRCLEGEEQHFEAGFDCPQSGPRRFEINLYPGPMPELRQAIVVIRDITARKRVENHLQLLLEIVHLLSFSPDLASATTSILKRLCAVSMWPLGEVWIPTPDGAIELFSAAHRADFAAGAKFHRETGGLTLRIGEGLLAELWGGNPAFIPDLAVDPAVFRAPAAAEAGFQSAFAIPLKSGEHTLALMLFFLTGDQRPDGHWMSLAHAIAAELGAVFNRERMQEQLDSFFNHSLDMHCLAGLDGFLKRVNPAWTRTLGYSTGELLSRPLIELIHPEDRPLFLEKISRLADGEDLTALEVRCVCRDDSTKWTLWNATPLPTQHLIIATSRDITERKRTENAVLQSEEHYRDLFHQAFQMQENLRKMSDRVLKIQEHERSRISRDLHDEVGQALTAINMNLAVLRNMLVGSPPDVERRVADTQSLIEQTMGSIHNFSRELRPAMLDDLGLLPALRNYVKSFIERTSIAIQLDATQSEIIEQLDSERKTVVYRIVQEGLNNVAKHAGAKRVEIVIAGSMHDVRLQVADDGKGFSLGTQPEASPKQLGLLGLAERARLVGGEFAIASLPERGTILRATIPFKAP
ncbi:MAG: domain S-box-containing protein [Lacunisphaera sp.]|nr:domain S-box-containing protein [Lacunisphaera sp.]